MMKADVIEHLCYLYLIIFCRYLSVNINAMGSFPRSAFPFEDNGKYAVRAYRLGELSYIKIAMAIKLPEFATIFYFFFFFFWSFFVFF